MGWPKAPKTSTSMGGFTGDESGEASLNAVEQQLCAILLQVFSPGLASHCWHRSCLQQFILKHEDLRLLQTHWWCKFLGSSMSRAVTLLRALLSLPAALPRSLIFTPRWLLGSKGCSAKMQAEQVVPNPYKLLLLGVLALGGALPVTVVLLWDIQVAGLHQVQLDWICSSSFHHLLRLLASQGQITCSAFEQRADKLKPRTAIMCCPLLLIPASFSCWWSRIKNFHCKHFGRLNTHREKLFEIHNNNNNK